MPMDDEHSDMSLREIANSIDGIARMMEQMASAIAAPVGDRARPAPTDTGTPAGATETQVATWDDPFSERSPTAHPKLATPLAVVFPTFVNPRMRIAISGAAPPKRVFAPGTAEFRYWVAAEALARGVAFWSDVLPAETTWSTTNPMKVDLVAGPDLNARYFRQLGLKFYRGLVDAVDIYSAESPDVVCHELGHAVLDALKPQLFEHANDETSAFHESFGDISSILCAMQIAPYRQTLLDDTGGSIHLNSRFSRLAEHLGWALRRKGSSVDVDCLRNAANQFQYRAPWTLGDDGPDALLSAEPHSFSRVFTGAFLDALSRMFKIETTVDEAHLRTVVRNAAVILTNGILAAPVQEDYYAQVATGMVEADRVMFSGRYRSALTSAFVGRGILSANAGMAAVASRRTHRARVGGAAVAGMADSAPVVLAMDGAEPDDGFMKGFGETPQLPRRGLTIDGFTLLVHAPSETSPRFDVAPSARSYGIAGAGAARGDVARLFVDGLIARGELDAGPMTERLPFGHKPGDRTTHEIVNEKGMMVLRRRNFACRCCAAPVFEPGQNPSRSRSPLG